MPAVSPSLTLTVMFLVKVFLSTCPEKTPIVPLRIWMEKIFVVDLFALLLMILARDPITIAAMIVVMTGAMIVTTIVGMTDTVVIALARPLVVVNTMTVAHPGLRPPGGRLMIEGLQGMIKTDAGMTGNETIKKTDTRTDPPGKTAKDGRVERSVL